MMKSSLSHALVLYILSYLLLLNPIHAASKSKTSSIAIPRSKSTTTSIFNIFNQGPIKSLIRELKSSFSSDLEALTLQLTKPIDINIPSPILDEFIQSIDTDYENPEFLVSLFVKLSRKLSELNIYTKLKVLMSLHVLIDSVSDQAKHAVLQCLDSLRKEHDNKIGLDFFSLQAIDNFVSIASNVGELEALELSRSYGEYVVSYMEVSLSLITHNRTNSKKNNFKSININELVNSILSLLDQSEDVESICKKTSCNLSKTCLHYTKSNRVFILKQLNKFYETGITDDVVKTEVEAVLTRLDSKFKPLKPISSSSSISPSKSSSDIKPEVVKVDKTIIKSEMKTSSEDTVAPKEVSIDKSSNKDKIQEPSPVSSKSANIKVDKVSSANIISNPLKSSKLARSAAAAVNKVSSTTSKPVSDSSKGSKPSSSLEKANTASKPSAVSRNSSSVTKSSVEKASSGVKTVRTAGKTTSSKSKKASSGSSSSSSEGKKKTSQSSVAKSKTNKKKN